MTVYLRGHHLLCILNWKGVGYTPEFTANYDRLMGRIMNEGAAIRIIKGPDDICNVLSPENYEDYHCDCEKRASRDAKAIDNINSFFRKNNLLEWCEGQDIFLTVDMLKLLRQAFKNNEIRAGCVGCKFYDFCTDIADSDFKDTRLNL